MPQQLEGNLTLGNIASHVAGSVVDIQTSGAGGTVTVGTIGAARWWCWRCNY